MMGAVKPTTRMREFRREMRWSRKELARRLGIRVDTVRRWEAEGPPGEIVTPLAEYFGVSVPFFLGCERLPLSAIPEDWREHVARDGGERADRAVSDGFRSLLEAVEWRLRVIDLDAPEYGRFQRFRLALLSCAADARIIEEVS